MHDTDWYTDTIPVTCRLETTAGFPSWSRHLQSLRLHTCLPCQVHWPVPGLAARGMGIGWAIDEMLHHKLLQICATSSMSAYVLWLWSFTCGTSQRWSGMIKSIQQSETKSIRKDTQGLFLVELTIAYPFSPALPEVVLQYWGGLSRRHPVPCARMTWRWVAGL